MVYRLLFIIPFLIFANISLGQVAPRIKAFLNKSTTDIFKLKDTNSFRLDFCLKDSLFLEIDDNTLPNNLNLDEIKFEWKISGVGFKQGKSIVFSPKKTGGFNVKVRINWVDPNDPLNFYLDSAYCKLRVSSVPSFKAFSDVPDSLCMDKSFVTPFVKKDGAQETDPITLKKQSFNIGGLDKIETPLPDGNGDDYPSEVYIDDYGMNSVISNTKDIDEICISMEHSFLGDLEMKLTCPTGQSVILLNSFKGDGGMIPGGFDGKDISLGNDLEIDNGPQGAPQWQYCFSSSTANYGTMGDENLVQNYVINSINNPSMNPNGVYLPEESFKKFIGCPVKGKWKITVRDNSNGDDGYIFNWGIMFNAESFPFLESYQNKIVTQLWDQNKAIVETDSNFTLTPKILGHNEYKYKVTTDFGCKYDTIIKIGTKLCLTIPNIVMLGSKSGNDKFFVNTGDVKNFDLGIYNRWGNEVFKTNNVLEGWDGKSKSGKTEDEGVYYYVVELLFNNGTEAKRNGYFLLKH
jgi:subtilisin-like proprotein convertase family protein